MPLKILSTGSIFHDIDAIWSSRLILSDRLPVFCRFANLALSSGCYWLLIIETYICIYPFHVPLKKLSTVSIFHDIDAIWSPRLIFSDRPPVLLPVH